ncbi:MAG: putative metallopeptidase [Methylotenera sp.]
MSAQDVYDDVCARLGIYDAPPIHVVDLVNAAARVVTTEATKNSGTELVWVNRIIEIDASRWLAASHEQRELLIAHELTHLFAAQRVGGGGYTKDGENHGYAFMSGFLFLASQLDFKKAKLTELAKWHAIKYEIDYQHLDLTVSAALTATNIFDAMQRVSAHDMPVPLCWRQRFALFGICPTFILFYIYAYFNF